MKQMTNEQKDSIIKRFQKYFGLHEVVSQAVIKKYGIVKAWQFVDFDLMHVMVIIREELGLSITINTKGAQQRGLRENTSAILLKKILMFKLGKWAVRAFFKMYLSAHTMGKAFDFTVSGMTSEEVRGWLVNNSHLLPCKIRLEHKMKDRNKNSPTYGQMIPITWVHLDVFYLSSNPNVYLFDV